MLSRGRAGVFRNLISKIGAALNALTRKSCYNLPNDLERLSVKRGHGSSKRGSLALRMNALSQELARGDCLES